MDKRNLIIDTPSLQDLYLKYTTAIITLIFWIIWFYLWIPVLTLLAWGMGFQVFHHVMVVLDGWQGFLQELTDLTCYVSVLVMSLSIWSAYNYFRFRRLERRKPLPPVTRMAILKKFNIKDSDLDCLRCSQIMTVRFDDDDIVHPVRVK